jgi:hypothetical protein
MNRPSDEILIAYVDGTLDARVRAETEAFLSTNEEARAFVDALRRSGALAAQAFDQPMREPPPPHLVQTIRNARDAGRRTSARRNDFGSSRMRRFALPLAASVAFVAAVGAAFWGGRMMSGDAAADFALGPVPVQSAVARMLETKASGQIVPVDGQPGRHFTVVATFRDRHDRPCREIEMLQGGANAQPLLVGVACRRMEGGWTVEGAVRLAAAPPDAGPGGYVPAGNAEKDALEGLLAALGAQKALGAGDEQALIAKGWR